MDYKLECSFDSYLTNSVVWCVKIFQFVSIIKPRLEYILDNADGPNSTPCIAAEINGGFWIVTDLNRWQQFHRYAPGPLSDKTGGILVKHNQVILTIKDLAQIKQELVNLEM